MSHSVVPCERVPGTLFTLSAPPQAYPFPMQTRRHWTATAHLLERLLNEPHINVSTIDFPTLQALYLATCEIIVQEDVDDGLELTDELMQDFNRNPWSMVLNEGSIPVDITRLHPIPWVYDVFY